MRNLECHIGFMKIREFLLTSNPAVLQIVAQKYRYRMRNLECHIGVGGIWSAASAPYEYFVKSVEFEFKIWYTIKQCLRQHRTINGYRLCRTLACVFSVILHKFRLTGVSLPALNLYNLTKNLLSNRTTIIMRYCLKRVNQSVFEQNKTAGTVRRFRSLLINRGGNRSRIPRPLSS